MIHSIQCIQVLNECDFKDEAYKMVEEWLVFHTPDQLIKMVWKKDPNGIHDYKWFDQIVKCYLKKFNIGIIVNFNDKFWETYDYICQFVEPFDIRNLTLINEMSGDMNKLRTAISKSKPNIKYLWKVFSNIEIKNIKYRTANDIPDIKNYGVQI